MCPRLKCMLCGQKAASSWDELEAAASAWPGKKLQLHAGKTAGRPADGSWPAKSEDGGMSWPVAG